MAEVEPARRDHRRLRFAIIGAGMAGMLAGIRLKRRGDEDFVIFEKADRVGGTWRENHYPGLTCDVPAHSYTYSFAPNPDWSAYFAPGPEIQGYFEQMADRHDLAKHIRFGSEVTMACLEQGRWRLTLKDGRTDVADVVVAATGVLHHPNLPDIPGLGSFAGPAFHSARWDHSASLDGRRIGVIGNGSTGVQLITALAGRAQRLVHFQRSPQWIMPVPDIRYSEADRRAFREDPAKIEEVRSGPEAKARRARFTSAIIDVDSPELADMQRVVERNLEESVRDPVLREKLRPDYRVACKRLIFSAGYYQAVQHPSVLVETGGIERVTPTGVRMKDGTLHELDVLVLATGFKTDQFVRPMVVTGRGGVSLDAVWTPRPTAYFAVAVPEFPNFFLLNGPTGPVGNFSLIDIAEQQWAYIDQLVDLLRDGSCTEVSVKQSALDDYERRRTAAAKNTVFASGCNSWYLDSSGAPQVWPWNYDYFVQEMSRPRLEDFQLVATDHLESA